MKKNPLLFFIVYVALFYGCSLENELSPSQVMGIIQSKNGSPIADVKVEIVLLKKTTSTTTNAEGVYKFENVRPGLGILSLTKTNYIPFQKEIVIYADETKKLNYTLESLSEESFLELKTKDVVLQNIETSATLIVETNASYTIDYEGDWIKIEEKTYHPEDPILIESLKNETSTERSAKIIIKGEYGQIIETTIRQKAGPYLRLLSSENLENVTDFLSNTPKLTYSRPIKSVQITSSNGSDSLWWEVVDNGYAFQFKDKMFSPVEKNEYSITVEDMDGIKIDTTFSKQLYLTSFKTAQSFRQTILTREDKNCWFLGGGNAQLRSIPELDLIAEINDSFSYLLSYNPYNDYFYLGERTGEEDYILKIHNSTTGEFVQTISLPSFSYIPPIAFSTNGLGVFFSGNKHYTIDSANNHKVELLEGQEIMYDPHQTNTLLVNHVKACENGKGFIFYRENPIESVFYLDAETRLIKKVLSPPGDSYYKLVVSNKTSNILLGGGKGFKIIHTKTNTEKEYFLPEEFNHCVLIEKGEEVEYVLFFREKAMYVYNCKENSYKKTHTPIEFFPCSESLTNKYLILAHETNNNSTSYCLFETDLFTHLK